MLAAGTAVCITAVFYALMGLFGYLAFPRTAKSNILNSFGGADRVMQARRGRGRAASTATCKQ